MPIGLNGTRQIIDLPAKGGGFVSILATGPVKRVIVKESLIKKDGVTAVVPQGCLVQDLSDGFVQTYVLPAAVPATEPNFPTIKIPDGDDQSFRGEVGSVIGNGPSINIGQGVGAATVLLKMTSNTATPTSVEVVQIY